MRLPSTLFSSMNSTSFQGRLAAFAVLAGLLAGCSSVKTKTEGGFAPGVGATYLWVDEGDPSPAVAGLGKDVPWEALREAFDAGLQGRGLVKAEGSEANLKAQMFLGFEIVTRQNDPYFEFYIADRYEKVSLILVLSDSEDGIWSGRDEHKLRYVEHALGGVIGENWIDAEQPRDWTVDEFVEGIIESVPIQD